MTESINLISGIILVVLLILLVVIFNTRVNESNLLTGFWCADAEFCEKADLDLLIIYIGSSYTITHKRPGYILMKNSDGIIINAPVEFSLFGGISVMPWVCKDRVFSLTIDWLDEQAPDFFPTEQDLYYYPTCGKLVFVSNDQVNAVVYKDSQMSSSSHDIPANVVQPTDLSDVGDTNELR